MQREQDRDLIGKNQTRQQITTPALLLDLNALEKNIQTMASLAKDGKMKLRPHCKSHKSINIAKLQKKYGAVGISCATIGEAEKMVEGGLAGVLITSPVVHSRKISRLILLNQQADDLIVVVDGPANVKALAHANSKSDKSLQVLIDIDHKPSCVRLHYRCWAQSLCDRWASATSLSRSS